MKVRSLGLLVILQVIFSSASIASDKDSSPPDEEMIKGVVPEVSIEALGNIQGDSGAYARNAEYCLQHGYVDRAIKLCQLALNNKDDPDLHQIYATALEAKLKDQEEKDPTLFRKCVAEWLIVLRQSGGEENLAFHGASLPGVGKFFEDEDRSMPAKQHIQHLTGHLPKVWETNDRFVKRVTKEFESSVAGRVMTPSPNEKQSSTEKQFSAEDQSSTKKQSPEKQTSGPAER